MSAEASQFPIECNLVFTADTQIHFLISGFNRERHFNNNIVQGWGNFYVQCHQYDQSIFLSDPSPIMVYSCHSLHYRLRAIRGGPLGLVNFTPHFIVIQIFQILFLPSVSFYAPKYFRYICKGQNKPF